MNRNKQQLRKLARIALLLLIGATVGLLAGQMDDNDDNFGIASLEPQVVHRMVATSRDHALPAAVQVGCIAVPSAAIRVATDNQLTLSPTHCAPMLAIPLRT